MLQTAAYLCCSDRHANIILDGRTFSRRYQVDTVVEAARRCERRSNSSTACAAMLPPLRGSPTTRNTMPSRPPTATPRSTTPVKARFEPPTLPHLTVNTDDPLDVCLDACRHYLNA